jgi:hypothetical protein
MTSRSRATVHYGRIKSLKQYFIDNSQSDRCWQRAAVVPDPQRCQRETSDGIRDQGSARVTGVPRIEGTQLLRDLTASEIGGASPHIRYRPGGRSIGLRSTERCPRRSPHLRRLFSVSATG